MAQIEDNLNEKIKNISKPMMLPKGEQLLKAEISEPTPTEEKSFGSHKSLTLPRQLDKIQNISQISTSKSINDQQSIEAREIKEIEEKLV
jgi:hypothetical protein